MHTPRKFWLVLIGVVAAFAVIACSCSSLIPGSISNFLSTATAAVVTMPPVNVNPSGEEPMPGLTGAWLDPDSSGGGTVSTIAWQNNEYVVVSVINSNRGPNELTRSNWAEGVLTWEYCPEGFACVTQSTVSLHGDTLTVNWQNEGGNSGTSDLTRYQP